MPEQLEKREVLRGVSFGKRIAEEEVDELAGYFVETDQWKRIYGGDVDVVYGPKGSGKSAIYSLLMAREDELFDRGIVLVAAENPRGAPAFKDLVTDPPASEPEFVALWKLYLLCLIAESLREYGVGGDAANALVAPLEEAGLIQPEKRTSLQALLRGVQDYARRILRAESLEGGLTFDPSTGLPTGVSGRITLREPSADEGARGLVSADTLLSLANAALSDSGNQLWLVLDRLDVAFADTDDLEKNALRALFKVYLDLAAFDRLSLKIFLRTDIWRRITYEGFREASHITRHATITWDPQSLLNLVIRRGLRNATIREYYGVTEEGVLGSVQAQSDLFYRLCPDQVEAGSRKSTTLDWILGRTRDGTGATAPRELIHFLSSLRDQQLKMLEVGHNEPAGELLFDRTAFKLALPEVSKVRLEQTLFAEHPALRPYLEKLEGEKTQQYPSTLAEIWEVEFDEAQRIGDALVDVGFFERRGSRDEPAYWVPHLYRDALQMVRGSADPARESEPDEEDEADETPTALF